VAEAAMASGVATRPIEDMDAYREQLSRYVYQSVLVMQPIFREAKRQPRRLVYAEGEDAKILRAVQSVVDEGIARPILLARPEVLEARIAQLGLRLRLGIDLDVVNPQANPRHREYARAYHELLGRKGVSPEEAKTIVRNKTTALAALMVRLGDADAMLCGITGRFHDHLKHVVDLLGLREDVRRPATMSGVVLKKGAYFLADTFVNPDPDAEDIAEVTRLAAQAVARFGLTPKVALLSHSDFGSSPVPQAVKMREALALLQQALPELEVDGEMRGEAAIVERIRDEMLPGARLRGEANLLVMPSLDAASIALGLLTVLGDAVPIGPILLGVARAAHILNPAATTRGILNMSALAVVDALQTQPAP
jgi:malate dehydrogenase (oxaloacetate-decarboxylating)(NADP+)